MLGFRDIFVAIYNLMLVNCLVLRVLTEDAKRYGGRNILRVYVRDPRFRAVTLLRIGCSLNCKQFIFKRALLRILKNRLALKYGVDTDFTVTIGPGLRIVHLGGIVIHRGSKIGNHLTILNNVTLGQGQRCEANVPSVGSNVYIGVGAVILGKVSIGDDCVVGAQSFVNSSFDAGDIIAGTPARVLRNKYRA